MGRRFRVLLIEDDLTHAMVIKQILYQDKNFSFDLHHATYLAGALNLLSKKDFDIILLDLNLPDSSGIQTIQSILKVRNSIPILSLTDYPQNNQLHELLDHGVQDYIPKQDLQHIDLISRIQFTIQRKQSEIAQAIPIKPVTNTPDKESISRHERLDQETPWMRV